MNRLIPICLLIASLSYAQSNVPITFTQINGINYPNVTLVQVDGIRYARATSGSTPVTPWQIPEYASSVLWYKFDEATNASGVIADSSYLSVNVATNRGTSAWLVSSNGIASCYSFPSGASSSTNYLEVLSSSYLIPSSNDFTINMWYRSRTSAQTTLYAEDGNGNQGVEVGQDTTEHFMFRAWTGSYRTVTSPAVYIDNIWRMGTVVRQGTNITLYVDGEPVQTGLTWPNYADGRTYRSVGVLRLGASTYAYRMSGEIDDFSIHTNKALTYSDIQNIKTNTYQFHGWSNSLALSNPSLYSNTVLEILGEYNYPADTSYIGTNHMTSYTGVNAYDPAWVNYQTGQGAWTFDGANDYLNMPSKFIAPSGSNFTVALWAKLQNSLNSESDALLSFSGDVWDLCAHRKATGSYSTFTNCLAFGNYAGAESTANDTLPLDNSWQFIVVSYDGSLATNLRHQAYLNGVYIPTTRIQPASSVYNVTNRTVSVGRRVIWGDQFVLGTLDDPRLYNRSLISNEVYSLFNTSKQNHTNSTPW